MIPIVNAIPQATKTLGLADTLQLLYTAMLAILIHSKLKATH